MPPTRRPTKVLVADDHSLTRNLVKTILKEAGFTEILLVDDGQAAIEAIFAGKADLVICDWNMPRATGLDVLRLVREEERFRKLPFLMLTAEMSRDNIMQAVEAGANDYMVKPFTTDTLMKKVLKLVEGAGG
jgi:two-component system chemotaxis response regulator CheY